MLHVERANVPIVRGCAEAHLYLEEFPRLRLLLSDQETAATALRALRFPAMACLARAALHGVTHCNCQLRNRR